MTASPAMDTTQYAPPAWMPVLCGAMAGGMGWGIRGQYGHETGATMAGLLVSLTLVLALTRGASSLALARAVAWGALGIGIGGSMTYGQTIGLTHDGALNGNWDALRWGLLGLAIKGAVWIGFGGTLLGMGLSNVRYRAGEMALLLASLVALFYLGEYGLNSPFNPAEKSLPVIYFSDDWHWEPDGELKPRPECWGGLLTALVALIAYAGWRRRDRLARNAACWGLIGGAIGFPAGQALQAYHAWNRECLAGTWVAQLQLNWWNVMEMTFGAIMGAALGLGLWINRRHIAPASEEAGETVSFPLSLELGLLAIHLPMLIAVEFLAIPAVDAVYDLGLIMAIVPLVAVAGGRWWPYLQILPLVLLPIAGKTVRHFAEDGLSTAGAFPWLVYGVVPMALALGVAIWSGQSSRLRQKGRPYVQLWLLLSVWIYFCLNYAFFNYPWPWQPWTGRTFSGIVYTLCAVGLTLMAVGATKRNPH